MELITDRTKSDVLLGTEKGYYGVADLNRVESAVAELAGIARLLDICGDIQVKTDWGEPDAFSAAQWPTAVQMRRYLDNVHHLCDTVELAASLPASMESLTWEGANQIEQALLLTYERLQSILQAFRFSGEFYAGEETGI